MKRLIWTLIAIVACFPFAATTTGCGLFTTRTIQVISAWLSDLATIVAQGDNAINLVQQFIDSSVTDPALKLKLNEDISKCRAGLNTIALLGQGSKAITQEQYDLAAKDFRAAWATLTIDLLGTGKLAGAKPGASGGFTVPEPMALTYRVRP